METFDNLVLSKEIAYFDGFGLICGITTIDYGSCHLLNPDEKKQNEKLAEKFEENFFCKIVTKHADRVEVIRFNNLKKYYEADALVFFKKRFDNRHVFPILISNTADCPTIILADDLNNAIAIIHSGRRGTQKNICRKTITTMRLDKTIGLKNIRAFVWGGICGNCYTANEEIRVAFPSQVKENRLDLKKIIIGQLKAAGIKTIITTDACSYCSTLAGKPLFHSHRRENNGLRNCVFVAF